MHVLPDPRRKQAVIACEPPEGATVSLRIDSDAHQIAADGNTFTVTFDEARAWSPADPYLYRAMLEVARSDVETESFDVPIGLREFTVAENRFRINQRPVAIRGASIRGMNAVDSATLEQLAALGYNAVRVPQKALGTDVLNAADAGGVLIFPTLEHDVPLSEVVSKDGAAFVQAHINHASIVAWHIRFQTKSMASTDRMEIVQRHIASVRAIDATRLIVCDVVDTDGFPLLSLTANPNKSIGELAQLARVAVSAPMCNELIQAGLGFGGDSVLVSADLVCPIVTDGTDGHPDLIDDAICEIVRALRSNVRVAGYWVDGDPAAAPVSRAVIAGSVHQPVRPIAELSQRNLWPGGETDARVTLANDSGMTGRVDLSLQVVGPTGQVLWKKKRGMPVPKTRKTIWQGAVGASSKPGLHRFVVRVINGHRVVGEESVPFHVLPRFEFSKTRVHIVGHASNTSVRSLSKIVGEIDAKVYVIPPLGNTIWAYPSDAVCQILALVQSGAAAIVLAPPTDWDALSQCFEGIPIVETIRPTLGHGAATYQTARHPILEGVRTDDVMGTSYQLIRRNVLLTGETDENVTTGTPCTFDPSCSPAEAIDEIKLNDIIVRSFGDGKLVFVNYDPIRHANSDPAAENLLRNLVDYGARRLVTGAKPPPFQKAIDFWRKRAASLIHWRVLGPLRVSGKLPTPPTHIDEFDAHYDGAYGSVHWRDWWATYVDNCDVDLAEVCQSETARELGNHGLVGYASHTFRSTVRESKIVTVESRVAARLWFNGRLIGSTAEVEGRVLTIDVTTREGVNIVVVEASADHRDWAFRFDIS